MAGRKRSNGKYSDALKAQVVAESRASGATAPMVAKRYGIPESRIYAWRGDPRYQSGARGAPGFASVEFSDEAVTEASSSLVSELNPLRCIEITLENGRRLSVGVGVDAGFVLELAGGLADAKIWLAAGVTDMRKGFHGLSAQTERVILIRGICFCSEGGGAIRSK